MASTYTANLGLTLPTTGELSGVWGETVNTGITALLDSAIAGTTTLSADANVTLSVTDGAANQARSAVILWTATNGANTRNVTVPSHTKAYIVINAGTGSVIIKGAATTGVTIATGVKALIAWNGSDFVRISSSAVALSDITGLGTGVATALAIAIGSAGAPVVNGGALGTPASGTLTNCTFPTLNQNTTGTASNVTGTVAIANGGTGQTTAQLAMNALAGAVTNGYVLQGNGTNVVMAAAPSAFNPAAPGPIGGTTPAAGSFTTLSATGLLDLSGAAAGQIKFPATQNASADPNTLDDYEEGTWTMGMKFGTGTTGITYALQGGAYVKIGRLVTVTGFVALTNKGSSTGDAIVTGLPFAVYNDNSAYSGASLNCDAITYTGSITGYAAKNNSAIFLFYQPETGASITLKDTNFANGSGIVLSAPYIS